MTAILIPEVNEFNVTAILIQEVNEFNMTASYTDTRCQSQFNMTCYTDTRGQ